MRNDFYFEIQNDAHYGSNVQPVTVENDILSYLNIFAFKIMNEKLQQFRRDQHWFTWIILENVGKDKSSGMFSFIH